MAFQELALLFLLILPLCCTCTQNTYYVTPSSDVPCPAEPCRTLSEYAEHTEQFFISNTTFLFLPGDHTLNERIQIENTTKLTLKGEFSTFPNITSRIACHQSGYFSYSNAIEVQISGLAVISCGMGFTAVNSSMISNCTFQNCGSFSLLSSGIDVIRNHFTESGVVITMSKVNITNNVFTNNIDDTAASVQISTVNFTGNNFTNNDQRAVFISDCCYTDPGRKSALGGTIVSFTENNFVSNSASLFDGGGAIKMKSGIAIFTRNNFLNNYAFSGGGAVELDSVTVSFTENSFVSNTVLFNGGAVQLHSVTGNFTRNRFIDNMAIALGGAICLNSSTVSFIENSVINNYCAGYGGGIAIFQGSMLTFNGNSLMLNNTSLFFGGAVFASINCTLNVFGNLTVESNEAVYYGGGIMIQYSRLIFSNHANVHGNKAEYGAGFYIDTSYVSFKGVSSVHNNMASLGGGVYSTASNLYFDNSTTFTKNVASNGGGAFLAGNSILYLHANSVVTFADNKAEERGGAIKVEVSNLLAYCPSADFVSPECFVQLVGNTDVNTSIYFDNNTALLGGSDLYGGAIDNCLNQEVIDTITAKADVDISSDPLNICNCENDQPISSCTNDPISRQVYPGETLRVAVIALGQKSVNVSAIVLASISDDGQIHFQRKSDYTQEINATCTNVTYVVMSAVEQTQEQIELYVNGLCLREDRMLVVNVEILKCPQGFQLSVKDERCVCQERLRNLEVTCNIDNRTILRPHGSTFWVAYDNSSDNLILHPHCPFDYCTSEGKYVSLQDLEDADIQCNYNRTGLLCGGCRENFSMVFSSSQCLPCTNNYLALITVFAFAGIALVLLLFILKLTVSIGTINGLVFYANILAVNSSIFFPPGVTKIVTIFIAWINLDLGFEACFYDGMDTYAKTWLQFVFPIYVWALVVMIIVFSRYSTGRIARLFGRNPIAVLATLFLLSYAKLLRTIIAAFSVTFLEYPGNKNVPVWLYDGNIMYLKGKHIPLFIAAVLVLLFLFLPYTLLLFLGQWLQSRSVRKVFSWINSYKIKPFLDAYHAPYTDKHRYWTGFLLLIRCALYLVSAFNVFGDQSVNLLSILTVTVGVLTLLTLFTGRVYKNWYLGILEVSFLLNLILLTAATYHVTATGGNQAAVVYTSIGIAFTIFIGIFTYHIYLQIRETKVWKQMNKKESLYLSDGNDSTENITSPVSMQMRPTYSTIQFRESLIDT